MARAGTSKHRVGKRKVVEIDRRWNPAHRAAGYHEQEWGEHAHEKHRLLGSHETANGRIVVEHVEGEPVYNSLGVLVSGSVTVGPEFKLTLSNGASLTVLCADVVQQYLDGEGGAAPAAGTP